MRFTIGRRKCAQVWSLLASLFIPANALFSKLLDGGRQNSSFFCLIAISKWLCYTLVASRSNRLRFLTREAIQLWKTVLY